MPPKLVISEHPTSGIITQDGGVEKCSPINGLPLNVKLSNPGHHDDSASTSFQAFSLLKDSEICLRECDRCWADSGKGIAPIPFDVKITRSRLETIHLTRRSPEGKARTIGNGVTS